MPSIATGAAAANRELYLLGVSGDGDSLSIGLGQFAHAVRRNIDMLYIIENNGVYGLTKGQFSASADIGTAAKRGEVNEQPPIDPVQLTMALGGTFVARSFSGDKDQLVPLIKGPGMRHEGFAMIDVLSPCVTFNDHEASTKSYQYTREHSHEVMHTDFVPPMPGIRVAYEEGEVVPITMHDGSRLLLRKVSDDYDPHSRGAAIEYIRTHQRKGEIVTGPAFRRRKRARHARHQFDYGHAAQRARVPLPLSRQEAPRVAAAPLPLTDARRARRHGGWRSCFPWKQAVRPCDRSRLTGFA